MRDCRWTDFARDPFIKPWMDTHTNRIPLTKEHEVAVSKPCYWGSQHGNIWTPPWSAITISVLSGWPWSWLVARSTPKTSTCVDSLTFARWGWMCKEDLQDSRASRNEMVGVLTMKCFGFRLIAFFSSQIQSPCSLSAAPLPGAVTFFFKRDHASSFQFGTHGGGERGGHVQGRVWGIWPCPWICGLHVLSKSGIGEKGFLIVQIIQKKRVLAGHGHPKCPWAVNPMAFIKLEMWGFTGIE